MDTPQSDALPSSKMSGFSVPKAQKPETVPVPPESLASTFLSDDGAIDDLVQRAEAALPDQGVAEAVQEKDSVMSYGDRIKQLGLTMDQALKIIDALTVEGVYREEIQLTRTVRVTFVTRSTRFNSFLADRIDIADPKKVGKMTQMMTVYQLSASLEKYGDKTLAKFNDEMDPNEWEKALESRVKVVERLPAPVYGLLAARLADFDAKMLVVFSKGYEENF